MRRAREYVLVVDDDEAIRVVVEKVLRAEGLGVRCACDGDRAIAMLESEALPSPVMVELGMPGVSGIRVIERIEHDTRWKDIPVLVLTAGTSPEDLPPHRPGLHKPVDGPLLAQVVHRMMHPPGPICPLE